MNKSIVLTVCLNRRVKIVGDRYQAANRITRKHLLILEAAISKNQTDEMESRNLQLILPKALHATYSAEQQKWLINISEFIDIVRTHQK